MIPYAVAGPGGRIAPNQRMLGISSGLNRVLFLLALASFLAAAGPGESQEGDWTEVDQRDRFIPAAEDPAIAEAKMAIRLKDYDRAIAIWRKAAARGNPEAAYRLGVAYRSGFGVEKDNGEAVKWFRIAVGGGDYAAQFALGKFYQNGIVVEQDRDEAIRLFGLSARSGNREAKASLERLQKSGAYASSNARVLANRRDPREALAQAIRLRDAGSAKEALARGAPVNGAPGDKKHWRPLILAIEHDDLDMVRLLLQHGATADLRSRIGEPALVLGVRRGQRKTVRALLAAGADRNVRAVSGYTPLMEAARLGNAGIVDDLLSAGGDPKLVLDDGTSAAGIARRFGNSTLAAEFKRRGAPVVGGTERGERREVLTNRAGAGAKSGPEIPPVVEAARRGDAKLLAEIIELGIDLAVSDSDGANALTRAAEGGHVEAVKLLLASGVAPDLPGAEGATALMRAMASTEKGAGEVMGILLDAGADPHARAAGGRGVFDFSAEGGTKRKLQLLADRGGSWTPNSMRTVMGRASSAGRIPVLKALLVFAEWPKEMTGALCSAVEQGHLETISLLVGAGADITENCGGNATPLIVAANNGNREIVVRLIAVGASPDAGSPAGRDAALIAAAGRGHGAIVELLLEKGADLDRRGAQRMTALMAAAANGHAKVVDILLRAGADRGMRSETKLTALDFAQQSGNETTVQLIESFRPGWRDMLGLSGN